MNHRPLVFVDVETTGGRSDKSKIIDIGIIRVENGRVVETMNQLIRPDVPVPGFITRLTGITNEMLWDQPTFEALAPELEIIFQDALFIAHHVSFDYGFIKSEFKRIGINFNSDRACTVKLSRLLHPEQRRHGLDMIIERMGLSVENRHRGYDDAEVLWKFFEQESEQTSMDAFAALGTVTTKTIKKAVMKNTDQLSLF
jgi:DNA polymerase-3 subunit epsilon